MMNLEFVCTPNCKEVELPMDTISKRTDAIDAIDEILCKGLEVTLENVLDVTLERGFEPSDALEAVAFDFNSCVL
jgi:hypothetical protein